MMKNSDKSSESILGDDLKTVSYIVNNEGNQELVPGTYWQPVDIVNQQAWQEIERQIENSKEKISAGQVSCLHYYMIANQMDCTLLAKYTGQSRWLVRLHLLPFFFKRLSERKIRIYANFFNVTSQDLRQGRLKPAIYNHQKNAVQSSE